MKGDLRITLNGMKSIEKTRGWEILYHWRQNMIKKKSLIAMTSESRTVRGRKKARNRWNEHKENVKGRETRRIWIL